MSYDTSPEIECGTYEQAAAKPKPTFRRVPLAPELNRVRAAATLANPHFRCSRAGRKALHHLRSHVLTPIEPQEKKPFPVKFALKLTTLKLTQLVRRQKKFAHEASTAKHLLAKMSPGPSRLRNAMTQRQDDSLARLGQVTAEIKARALACQGRLAETL